MHDGELRVSERSAAEEAVPASDRLGVPAVAHVGEEHGKVGVRLALLFVRDASAGAVAIRGGAGLALARLGELQPGHRYEDDLPAAHADGLALVVPVQLPPAVRVSPEALRDRVDRLGVPRDVRHHGGRLDLLPLDGRHPRDALVRAGEQLRARLVARAEPRRRQVGPRLALQDRVVSGGRHLEAHPRHDDRAALDVERVRAHEDVLELRVSVDALGDEREGLSGLHDVREGPGLTWRQRRRETDRQAGNPRAPGHRPCSWSPALSAGRALAPESCPGVPGETAITTSSVRTSPGPRVIVCFCTAALGWIRVT